MQLISLPTLWRLSAFFAVFSRTGVNAQSGPSPVCDGSVTVTFVPPPFTVTVFTTGIFNTSDIPSLSGIPSGPSGGIEPSFSLHTDPILTLSSTNPTTDLPSDTTLLSDLPSYPLSDANSLTTPALSISPGASFSIPTISTSLSLNTDLSASITGNIPSQLSATPTISTDLPFSLSTISVDLTASTPSVSLYSNPTLSASISLPTGPDAATLQLSSLSGVLGTSVTLPGASLNSTLITLGQSSPTLSLNSQLPSLTSLTLSLTNIPSGLSTSLEIPTGQTISLSSVTVSPSLPSISLSASTGLPDLGLSASRTSSVSIPSVSLSVTNPPIPTATTLSLLSCPADNGLNYLSPGGKSFQLECGVERLGNVISRAVEPNLQTCIDSCDDVSGCVGVSYIPASGLCSYEDGVTSNTLPNDNGISASPVDLSCDGADGADFMDYTGGSYRVLCDYEYPAGSEIRSTSSPGFADCSDDCTELAECTAFSYTNNVCTFLRGYGTPPTGATRNGTSTFVLLSKRAVRVVNGSTVYDTSTPGTVPPYSTSRSLSPATRTGQSVTASTMPTSVSIPSLSVSTAITSVTGVGSAVSSALSGITGLTSMLTLPSASVTRVFVGSSALVATSQGPTQTPVAYSCPSQDGQVLVENGQSYVLNCNSSTSGEHYSTRSAASSFNDCFRECDQSSTNEGARYCTAFTYEGPSNGQGSGTCYLYNGVTQGFTASTGTRSISAIRAVNYAPEAGGGAASSALSGLTGLTTPTPSTSLTLSLSVPTASVTSVNTAVNVGLTGTLGASISVGAGAGLTIGAGSSGLSVGVNPTLGVGVSAGLGLGGGGGAGGGAGMSTSTTSDYNTPLAPVLTTTITVTPTPTFTTTTVHTTSTITSCLTGVSGVLTCPIGGLFTTLPSTSGAVTSISTSISVSISYVTVTTSGTSPSPTISTFSTRTSSSSSSKSTTSSCVLGVGGSCIV